MSLPLIAVLLTKLSYLKRCPSRFAPFPPDSNGCRKPVYFHFVSSSYKKDCEKFMNETESLKIAPPDSSSNASSDEKIHFGITGERVV